MEGGRRVVLTPGPPQGISSYVPPKCILMEQGHCPKGSPEKVNSLQILNYQQVVYSLSATSAH